MSARRSFLLVAVTAILSSAVTAFSAREHFHRQMDTMESVMLARQAENIAEMAREYGKADALIVGDSILNMVPVDCGRTFRLTVAAIRSPEIIPSAVKVQRLTRPAVTIVGLGTNDQRDFRRPADLRAFAGWPGRILWVEAPTSPETNRNAAELARRRGETVYKLPPPGPDGVHPDNGGQARMRQELGALCRSMASARHAGR